MASGGPNEPFPVRQLVDALVVALRTNLSLFTTLGPKDDKEDSISRWEALMQDVLSQHRERSATQGETSFAGVESAQRLITQMAEHERNQPFMVERPQG